MKENMVESQAFNRLHEGVQRWIWNEKWDDLRSIQEQAVEPILKGDCDVIISAATAAGKTEAAFLPACSRVMELSTDGVGILYISPLKALINDQYRRLKSLGGILNLPITPWHGDVSRSVKEKQKKNPSGIILITPESLESLLLNQGNWCAEAFRSLSHIIVDEFHVFLGTERGCQLQSLMCRLEFLLQRTIPRVALSATLGDIEKMASYLRPDGKIPSKTIDSTKSVSDLKVQQRGYVEPANVDEETTSAFEDITNDLYKILRGESNLVFANSREKTEGIAAILTRKCERNCVPNEFFPHHGNLSKEIRHSLESRLQKEKLPTTAVCTTTLELGVDIGSVHSIAQVTASPSVVSLRQRIGRSGRRGEPAVLRVFICENEITAKSHLLDRLRLDTLQSIATVNLLVKKWYEPPPENDFHFSTLVQQTLSVIGQYGGVRANQLWDLLCNKGPFSQVDHALYAKFLKALGEQELISQMHDGQLVLGWKGEKLVRHYTFYTAFKAPEEYRLEYKGKVLGTIPIDKPLMAKQLIIFAGKYWQVLSVNSEKKVIALKGAKGGEPPKFGGDGRLVHDVVRKEMLRIYQEKDCPIYLDRIAKSMFDEGLEYFHALNLDRNREIQIGETVHLFPWLGDRIIYTITALLRFQGLSADCCGGIISISNSSIDALCQVIETILSGPKPTSTALANNIPDTIVEKHDAMLTKELRDIGYGAKSFDVDSAWAWLTDMKSSTNG